MKNPIETVQAFYAALEQGNVESLVSLMAPDIERITMLDFQIDGRGPDQVVTKVLMPLMQEWASFAPSPSEFLVDGQTVVSLGRFTCVHRATGKRADSSYAHVWTVRDGQIARFRQYIDTLAIAEARRL